MGMDDPESGRKVVLPEKYYLTYFLDLVRFVENHSSHLLDCDDRAFLDQFFSLSENGQSLYIRLVNRKGLFFREGKLNYAEIDISSAIHELSSDGFISPVLTGTEELIRLFTKAELVANYSVLELPKKIKKEELYFELISNGDFQPLVTNYSIICVEHQEAIEYIKMLFFGHYNAQMTEFVVRDVGHVKLEDLSKHRFKPWFSSLEESKAVFDISQIKSKAIKKLRIFPASALHEVLMDLEFPRFQRFASSQTVLDKFLLTVAKQLEREKEPELALFYYEKCFDHPSRERRVRLYFLLNEIDEAERLAEKILQKPRNASELTFAIDFLQKPKKKILRSTTRKLQNTGKSITVKPDTCRKVESIAIEYFTDRGYQGIHGENYLWNNLFGLTFWYELLDSSFDTYHHPLQRTSSDIHKQDFFYNRKLQLKNRLDTIRTRKSWLADVGQLIEEKTGISNQFVYWHTDIRSHMSTMLKYMPLKGAKLMMMEMAKNLKENRKGFPDLLVWKDDEYCFYEVKSPNDQLSAQQLFWIDFMQSHKISADVLKLKYTESLRQIN